MMAFHNSIERAVVRDNAVRRLGIAAVAVRTVNGSPYTISVKTKWRTVVFWFFVAHSSADLVACTRGAREELADNSFQLLFIDIYRYRPNIYDYAEH